MEGNKILIADDDPKILKLLKDLLNQEGFEVISANNGHEVLGQFNNATPDLIVLDVMMPGMDGFEVCRKIRAESSIPIIILSAKSETPDRITGLTLGSDDYITKPFDSDELLLRIKSVLKRVVSNKDYQDEIIARSGLIVNRTMMMVNQGSKEITLTHKEFDLLWLLAKYPKRVFTREQLLYQIWGTEYCGDTGIVTTLVKRLREKIEPDPANPCYILTVRGVGYKFVEKPC